MPFLTLFSPHNCFLVSSYINLLYYYVCPFRSIMAGWPPPSSRGLISSSSLHTHSLSPPSSSYQHSQTLLWLSSFLASVWSSWELTTATWAVVWGAPQNWSCSVEGELTATYWCGLLQCSNMRYGWLQSHHSPLTSIPLSCDCRVLMVNRCQDRQQCMLTTGAVTMRTDSSVAIKTILYLSFLHNSYWTK